MFVMEGLDHQFLVAKHKEYSYGSYLELIHDPSAVCLHDDIVGYMWDTLRWLKSYLPRGNRDRLVEFEGLNPYGPTIIKSDGAKLAEKIFYQWAEIFLLGPRNLTLTGDFILPEGAEWGNYEVIRSKRDKLVEALNKISVMAERVASSKDELYLLHLGI